jgi:hypothetical protein
VFKALWLDGSRDFSCAGTAVVELRGCVATRFRYPGGEPNANDAHLTTALELCRAYEVKNSTWLKRVKGASSNESSAFGHFAFTFVSTSFECVAKEMIVSVKREPFGVIYAGLNAPR